VELLVENETQLVLRCYYGGLLGTLLFDCYNGNIPLPFAIFPAGRTFTAVERVERRPTKTGEDTRRQRAGWGRSHSSRVPVGVPREELPHYFFYS
jgi:hypothetical protein